MQVENLQQLVRSDCYYVAPAAFNRNQQCSTDVLFNLLGSIHS